MDATMPQKGILPHKHSDGSGNFLRATKILFASKTQIIILLDKTVVLLYLP